MPPFHHGEHGEKTEKSKKQGTTDFTDYTDFVGAPAWPRGWHGGAPKKDHGEGRYLEHVKMPHENREKILRN